MAVASMDHRGIDAVLKDMRQHPEDAKVQEKGCKALANLAVNAGNAVKIGAGGGVEAIVQAMGGHRGSEGVQREGCEAMRFLAINEGLQRRGCEALGHLALKSDTWNSTAFSPLDGANTSATSPPDVSNTSATSPPDGVNTSATSPPDGANTSATSPPDGANTSATIPPDGANTSATIPPDGANTSATIPPDGANTSATSPPDGANTSATIPPDGANTSATSPPDVSKTTDDGSKTTDDGLKTTDQNSTTDPPHDQHQSSTTDPPRVRKTTKSKFFDVNNLLYVAMDCVWDPENCDTSIFMAFFRKQFSECNKHFKFLLAFMRIYSHGAILFLKSFDHILHTFPKMQDFQTFGLEVGFVAVTWRRRGMQLLPILLYLFAICQLRNSFLTVMLMILAIVVCCISSSDFWNDHIEFVVAAMTWCCSFTAYVCCMIKRSRLKRRLTISIDSLQGLWSQVKQTQPQAKLDDLILYAIMLRMTALVEVLTEVERGSWAVDVTKEKISIVSVITEINTRASDLAGATRGSKTYPELFAELSVISHPQYVRL
jgi:hypothetical protein